MAHITITTTHNVQITWRTAGLGPRIVATLADFGIYVAYLVIVFNVLDELNINLGAFGIWVTFIPILFYHLVCEVLMNGQSPGKKITGIKVISLDGQRPALSQYLVRWVMRFIDISLLFPGGVAFISVAASRNEQRIGDKLAGTTVVSLRQRVNSSHVKLPTIENQYEPVFASVTVLSDRDVQIIERVLRARRKLQKQDVVLGAARKVQEVLQLEEVEMQPVDFLRTVVKDYPYLTSR